MNASLFQSLVELTSDAVLIVRVEANGREFVMQYVNDAYLQKFGVTRESVLYKEFRDMLRQEIVDDIRERFSYCAIHGERVQFEEGFGDGTTGLSELFPIAGTDGRTEFIVGISKDITELKKKRDQLAESEHTLQSIINSSDNILILLDLNWRIIYANKEAEEFAKRMFGLDFTPGDSLFKFAMDGTITQWQQHLQQVVETRKTVAYEHDITYPSGEQEWHLRRYYAVHDADGTLTGVVVTSINISERKQFEVQLQLNASKMREIAMIQSHEIRRPLANIMGLTELFDIQAKSLEENVEILNYLKISAQELDKLINRIVDTTQDEYGLDPGN